MHYFIGWDVGAWGCRQGSSSQDALVVLALQNDALYLVNNMWRGNLVGTLSAVDSLDKVINKHFKINIRGEDRITIAIDTPLGFPIDTVALFAGTRPVTPTLEPHACNSFIYRQTEMWLASKQFPPLSAIKDMIGSQATKGMYLLHKFGLTVPKGKCGVWAGGNVTAIECYPTTCKRSDRKGYICYGSKILQKMYRKLTENMKTPTADEEDAIYCALVAYLYGCHPDSLESPSKEAPPPATEGWVWYPKDAVGRQSKKKPEAYQ